MEKNKSLYYNAGRYNKNERKKSYILITGANGFLGTQIVRQLISIPDIIIIALVRAQDEDHAQTRLRRAWYKWDELLAALRSKVKVIAGDITREDLGIVNAHYHDLSSSVTHIIHTAADLRLHAPLNELFNTNLKGTCNLLKLAEKANEKGIFKRFSHLSTAYVAGKRKGLIAEDFGDEHYKSNHNFWSNYEKSKYEAELAVRQSSIPYSIFRPGMIVGDSRNGEIKKFNTIYTVLKLYMTRKFRFIPTNSFLILNIIPVDYVAQAISKITFNRKGEGKVFHLTAPYDSLPSIKEFLEEVRLWAVKKMNIQLPRPIFMSIAPLIRVLASISFRSKNRIINILFTLSPYLEEKHCFKRDNTDRLLDSFHPNWKDYLPHILEYAVYHGFFHRSERTVHEQILYRLKGRSYSVKYFNITSTGIRQKSTLELRREIIFAYHSLKKLDIHPGDSVAMAGANSTRYLTIDVAIGLLGAVSVPIYYTSPIAEVKSIIDASRAKIFFVGTQYLQEQVIATDFGVQLVSFCQKSESISPVIMSWSEFLKKGKGRMETCHSNIQTSADFSSLATIRYTSGTTDKPKGVTFQHKHLRWMAESLASLPPWESRNHEIRYLSFLPMNHVVEGILGAYSPYYAPAPVKIYFLEDFNQLASALRKVKPSIFFSVPRFYEKLWCRLKSNYLGGYYFTVKDRKLKRLLKPLIRRLFLSKAGLARCSQLIVGSATSSQQLIRKYHDLGVEIHNAYGLTEAPLVTLNRQGSNRLGTVGEPLPETLIKIAPDGEVLVKGPQVTPGYFELKTKPYKNDNWLRTGDIGFLKPEGSLVITGRKKELLINSYGKSINPLNIEALLRDALGICNVMLVGERRPYLAAILWVGEKYHPDEMDRTIQKVNQDLSHPEQIKRWVILANDLSIERGDLTANMKLKREMITQRYQVVIDSIYQGNFHPLMLHLGRIGRE